MNAAGGGETGGCQLHFNPVAREHYHTDWVADRTVNWLSSIGRRRRLVLLDELPRSAPPLGPAAVELKRHPWRDTAVPAFYPGSKEKIEKVLKDKPQHWMDGTPASA